MIKVDLHHIVNEIIASELEQALSAALGSVRYGKKINAEKFKAAFFKSLNEELVGTTLTVGC